MKFACIIPARYASTRFPGKPLVKIGDKTMIQRVYEQAIKVLRDVYVATDDDRIYNEVLGFGGRAVMTSDKHRSGTDRCYEAYTKLGQHFDVVINIQGDEPFIQPGQIQTLMDCFSDVQTQIATLVRKVSPDDGVDFLVNSNHPKVVINNQLEAILFSRAVIPFLRNIPVDDYLQHHTYYTHIGIYAYQTSVLERLVALSPSSLEIAESLEQLRWLENGYKIKVGFTTERSVGIDTQDDLKEVERLFL
ncbi:MAG: 3-deoxy-manno-octulosonate cytidylyltransferase [Paludibacter sp.]|nr:3-deoxy-manno-octulosonate cytidylyltransferase [Paludibacter sp.]